MFSLHGVCELFLMTSCVVLDLFPLVFVSDCFSCIFLCLS